MTDIRMVAEIYADGKQPECVVHTRNMDDWSWIREVVEGYVEILGTKLGMIYLNEDATTQGLPVNWAASKLLDWLFPESETLMIHGNVVVDCKDPKMATLVEAALLLRTLR